MEKEILHIGSRRPRIAMVSTHGYVSAHPPLGAADTGGQVVYVLELSKKLALQGFEVDIWTRRFEDQPEVELVSERTRIIRAPSGGRQFIPKEYLFETLGEWGDNALTFIRDRRLSYRFVDSHYWDGGIAGGILSSAAGVPHVHTPHSLGIWKMRQMEADFPGDAARFEKEYNFQARIHNEGRIYVKADAVVATTHLQRQLLSNEYGVPAEKCPVIPAG